MAIRVIDDSKLQDIAVAIQGKDGGGQMTVDEMPTRIAEIPLPVEKKDVNFYDWEGTLLFGYSVEEVQAMTSLPAPDTSPNYQRVDHDLLTFQKWTRNLTNIKTWVQNHSNQSLGVGAIYITTDGQDHNFWGNPRLDTATTISMQKRGTASIGSFEFQDRYCLAQVNIPDGVTSIGLHAFYNCNLLAQVNIPDGVTNIGDGAFTNCYLAQITVPNSITSIGSFAFHGCISLTQTNIPDGVTSIENGVFYNCTSLTSVTIPDSVTSIGSSAFYNCTSLTSVTIPDSVTSIGSSAFYICTSLTSVTIPDSVTSIGSKAFQGCRSLTQVNIPDGVTNIGDSAFLSCTALCDVLLESKPTLSNTYAFANLPSIYRLYVPRTDLSWFETATNWSTIYTQGHIVAIEDYIEYLESIGFNVDDYKEVTV